MKLDNNITDDSTKVVESRRSALSSNYPQPCVKWPYLVLTTPSISHTSNGSRPFPGLPKLTTACTKSPGHYKMGCGMHLLYRLRELYVA